jgi:hypothetical protein
VELGTWHTADIVSLEFVLAAIGGRETGGCRIRICRQTVKSRLPKKDNHSQNKDLGNCKTSANKAISGYCYRVVAVLKKNLEF